MRFQIPVFFSFWITLLSLPHNSMGQTDTLPYNKWIEYLSVKTDLRSEKFSRVFRDLQNIPVEKVCEVLSILKSKTSPRNPRLTIRVMIMDASLRLLREDIVECPGTNPSLQDLQEALNMAYDLEDDIVIFQVYSHLVSYYTRMSKDNQATLYGLLAKELYEKHDPDTIFPMSPILFNLSSSFYHAREYRATIDVLSKFLRFKDDQYLSLADTLSDEFSMFSWNTLGLAYTKLHIPDSAFIAFDKGMRFAEKLNIAFWKGLINGNRGDMYYQMGMYDSAQVLLEKDYSSSIAAGELDNAANSLQWLARIDLFHNKTQDALKKVREAKSALYRSYKPDYMANTLLTFTKVFTQLGYGDSVDYYLDRYIILHDSIEAAVTNARVDNVTMRLQEQENINTIKLLNKEKRKIALIRNFILTLIILFALLGFLILNRQKLRLKVRRQEAIEAKRLAELEATSAKEQLRQFTHNLFEKTSLVENLQAKLMEREMNEEQKNHITELSRHAILTDADWENFKTLFEKVYPAFFYQLRQKVTDLTAADQRMAAMSRLQMSNKEAASLLGIAPNSVIKAKQRLRHRLGLETEADLEAYFTQSKDFN